MTARMLGIAAAVSTCLAAPALAADAPGLAPSGPWTLDYADDSCALRRTFGEGSDQAFLELRRFEPGTALQTIITSQRMRARRPPKFNYRFGERDWERATPAYTVSVEDGSSGVLFISRILQVPEDQFADREQRDAYLRSIDWRASEERMADGLSSLRIRGAFRRELTLQTESLAKPIAALNECVDELLTHWGIDVEAHKTLTRAAIATNHADVASMMAYPPEAIRRHMEGIVNVRLAIDEHGSITECHIQMPLSDPAFESSSCDAFQHGLEFDPALDKDGKPIASYWVTKVIWRFDR